MVFFFKAVDSGAASEYDDFAVDGSATEHVIYMGKDKFENDPLIRKSHPKNLWFHVDNHLSAHLYLQLSREDQMVTFEALQLSQGLLDQIAQLTKANSIKANKLNKITVIYTPVDNLRSDGSMDTGTVTFHNPRKVKRIHVAKRDNAVVNKLNKTKTEVSTDQFVKDQEEMLRKWESDKRQRERKVDEEQKLQAKIYEEQKKRNQDPYAELFTEENMKGNSNEFRKENWVEDEFW